MKKIKMFNILLALAMFFMTPIVYAHNVELDPDDVVGIPLDAKGQLADTTVIEVDDSFGEYDLYYQYVKMDAGDFQEYVSIETEELEYAEENRPGSDASNDEKLEYRNTISEYEASKTALKPKYDDSNWVLSNDGTVSFIVGDDVDYNKGDPFVLWVKVVDKEGDKDPIYEEKLIVYNIDEPDVNSPATSDNMLIIGIFAVAAIGLLAISYKKVRA